MAGCNFSGMFEWAATVLRVKDMGGWTEAAPHLYLYQ